MKKILLFLSILSGTCALGQEGTKNKIRFQSINQIGFLEGSAGAAFQAQTINGIRIKSVSLGVGVGLDKYYLRSVPLFFDIRKNFPVGQQELFLYSGAGLNFTWASLEEQYQQSEFKNGHFYDFGLGYAIPVGSQAITFSLGYSLKTYKEDRERFFPCLWGECPSTVDTYSHTLRRISFKAGIRF